MNTHLFITTHKQTHIIDRGFAQSRARRWGLQWLKLGVILLLAGLSWQVRASDPVGIYAFIDKVVLEPNEAAPERIQIFGGFAMAEGGGEKYAPARKGFLYYTINPNKPEVSLKEWKDLKSLAGTGQIVSFAARHGKNGKVHSTDAKPESPDVYPLGFGLTKVKDSEYGPVKELVELRNKNGTTKASGKSSTAN